MALTLRTLYNASNKQIDKQTHRETSGKSKTDPRWAQAKRKTLVIVENPDGSVSRLYVTPSGDGRPKPKPQFVGGYGPKGKKHPDLVNGLRRVSLHPAKPWKMTEGDIPFDAKIPKHDLKNAKEANILFHRKDGTPSTMNLLAGKGNYGQPTGCPPPSVKRPSPLAISRVMVEGTGKALRPPLAKSSLGGFEQMVQGWVRR